MIDNINARGKLDCTLTRGDGTVKKWIVPNLVVSSGRAYIANLMSTNTVDPITHMGIGSSTTEPNLADIGLGSEIDIREFTSKMQGSGSVNNSVVFVADWEPGEGTGAITEAVLLTAASGGILFSRAVFPVQNKGINDTLSIQWTVKVD